MAGDSGTPLTQKLAIKAGHLVALLDPPKDFANTGGELPEGVPLLSKLSLSSAPDVVVWFVTRRAAPSEIKECAGLPSCGDSCWGTHPLSGAHGHRFEPGIASTFSMQMRRHGHLCPCLHHPQERRSRSA
jgi:hypothetical protein